MIPEEARLKRKKFLVSGCPLHRILSHVLLEGMTINSSLRILPESNAPTVNPPISQPLPICSSGWIMKICVPLMKWVVDAANAREMGREVDAVVPAFSESYSLDPDDGALARYILELCMLELLSAEIASSDFQLNERNHHKYISSIQIDCAEQYQLSVMIMFSELLVSGNRIGELNESSVDLLEYCMRKVRNECTNSALCVYQ
jgi:hypothetical protein